MYWGNFFYSSSSTSFIQFTRHGIERWRMKMHGIVNRVKSSIQSFFCMSPAKHPTFSNFIFLKLLLAQHNIRKLSLSLVIRTVVWIWENYNYRPLCAKAHSLSCHHHINNHNQPLLQQPQTSPTTNQALLSFIPQPST